MARATIVDEGAKISLRIPKRDLTHLKSRALQEGIPYQTLINAVIHRYVSDCGARSRSKTGAPWYEPSGWRRTATRFRAS